jgi:uncharacterized repeat protein (TIGR03803 family)
MDTAGSLYGTTTYGGTANCMGSGYGCGTVFKLDTHGVETVLYNFRGLSNLSEADGEHPVASLFMDANGDLYGTTAYGGGNGCPDGTASIGCGTVFKVSGKKETVLYRFTDGNRGYGGYTPIGGVVRDGSGALYGTTNVGGRYCCGVVFKLKGKKYTVLHSFSGGADGSSPYTMNLIRDAEGNLYGTAAYGGDLRHLAR